MDIAEGMRKMRKLSIAVVTGEQERESIMRALRANPDVEVAGEIRESHALRLLPRLAPDVVLLDGSMFALNGIACVQWLKSLVDPPVVVVVAATGSPAEASLYQEVGADAVLPPATPALLEDSARWIEADAGPAPFLSAA
jgi:DNA-binding NarL/FixJ family response regulator